MQHAENDVACTSKCNTYSTLCRNLSSDNARKMRSAGQGLCGGVGKRSLTHEILVICEEHWAVAVGWRHKSGQCMDLVYHEFGRATVERNECFPKSQQRLAVRTGLYRVSVPPH